MGDAMKAIRVSVEAAMAVDALAAERGASKGDTATELVFSGLAAVQSEGKSQEVAGIPCDTLAQVAGLVYEKRASRAPDSAVIYVETLASYAERKGLTHADALVRLVMVALGREAALTDDRARVKAGHAPRRPKGGPKAPPQPADRPLDLDAWDDEDSSNGVESLDPWGEPA